MNLIKSLINKIYIMSKELAYQIANRSFSNKKDLSGQPYFNHLTRVSNEFKEHKELFQVAILHDLLEDCPEWNEDSLRCLFDKHIVDTIVILTKNKGEDYFDYINRINQNSWATRVKLEDLKDNMDITRLNELTEKDFKRLEKYLKAYKILTGY